MDKKVLKSYLCDEIAFMNGIFGIVDEKGNLTFNTDYKAEEVPDMVDDSINYLCENGLDLYENGERMFVEVTKADFEGVREEVISMFQKLVA